MYDIVIVNKIYPFDVTNFLLCKNADKRFNYLVKYRATVLRLGTLLLIAIMLLSLRLGIMGFSTPKFLPVDNPTSFMDNILLRILNYNYIYCLNTWLLICPVWLCFDWSMGCIPLITGYDHRIFTIVIFWLMFGAMIMYTFVHRKDKNAR